MKQQKIKLRAWDEVSKAIYPVVSIDFTRGEYMLDVGDGIPEPSSNAVLMQFTGLHDAKGKEIYEGDIIKRDEDEIFFVEYDYGSFGTYIGKKDFKPGWRTLNLFTRDYKVIGNIYENFELLGTSV